MPDLVDFLTHAEKFVAASASDLWPFILDTNQWFTQRMNPAGGTAGQLGERFDVVHESRPAQVLFHMEIVELVPQRRRTARLDSTGGAFLGYATWVLREGDGGTQVGYHVYCRVTLPPGSSASGVLDDARQKMEEALERLRALAERAGIPRA